MALFHKAEKAEAGNSQTLEIMRRFRKNRSAMIGLTIFLVICLLAIFADVITPYSNATTQVKDARLLAPCAEHIFGTDHLGRDMFAGRDHVYPRRPAGIVHRGGFRHQSG